MSMFLDAIKRRKLIGAVVTAYRCDGCMAEDHVFLWVGKIEGFVEKWGQPQAVVTLIKKYPRPVSGKGDIRDGTLGMEHIHIHDARLQELYRGVYALYT